MLKQVVSILVVGFLAYYWQTKIVRGPVYNSDKDLSGKTVLVTGGNAGIGKSAAILFAKLGARVIIASRNIKKSEQACDEIIKQSKNNNVYSMQLDLGSFDSIKDFAQEFKTRENRLDYLVNNAGVLGIRGMHKNGFHKVMNINHFGPFLLTHLLLDLMTSSNEEGRIINVASSISSSYSYNLSIALEECDSVACDFQQYGQSKIANVLFTMELQKYLENTKVTTYSVHPGYIYTYIGSDISLPTYVEPILRFLISFFLRSPFYGAQTIMYCSLDDDVIMHRGRYFYECKHTVPYETIINDKNAQDLWKVSKKVVRKYLPNDGL